MRTKISHPSQISRFISKPFRPLFFFFFEIRPWCGWRKHSLNFGLGLFPKAAFFLSSSAAAFLCLAPNGRRR